jgi:predicted metal-dependent hydrolase
MSTAQITPRDIDFEIDPQKIADWNGGSFARSVFLNALSIMFPHGERYFIKSVAAFRDRIADPVLAQNVKGFIAQEALHTREHIAYNVALQQIVDADSLDRAVDEHLTWVWKTLPPRANLAATCALEHFTAILAREVLDNPEHLRGADEAYARLWTWHALEECEHKSVTFNVFQAVTSRGNYWLRVRVMVLATSTFVRFAVRHVIALVHARGLANSPRTWLAILWYLFGAPGLVRRIVMPYLRYYAPGFTPDHLDDRRVLDRVRRRIEAWT